MPESPLQQALRDSVADVLERMFFIQSLGQPPEPISGPQIGAYLTFEGAPSGSMTLRVTAPAARLVAADFLGEEEGSLSDEQIGEVVCELANMICGSVLSRVESATTFRLASPRILSPEEYTAVSPGGLQDLTDGGSRAIAVHTAEICDGALMAIVSTEKTA